MMYHLSGQDALGFTEEQFGAQFGGYDVSFGVATDGAKAERAELTASILATAEWK